MNTQPLALNGNSGLGVAIILGIILGFTLVKADFTWEKSCVRFFTLKSGRLIKTALMTVAFAAVGFYFAAKYGIVHITAVPTYLYSAILGGIISGIGFAAAGIMPASAIASLGAGRIYLVWTILGMIIAVPVKRIFEKIVAPPWEWGRAMPEPALAQEAFGLTNLVWIIAVGAVVVITIVQVLLPENEDKQ